MRQIGLTLAAAAALLMIVPMAHATAPRFLNLQGRLADSAGTPLTGTYSVTFRIFDNPSAGASCFTETQSIAVNSGLFNIDIGNATSGGIQGCDFSVPYYLEIQVGTDAPMTPRLALTAAAYSLSALVAEDANALQGKTVGSGAGQIPINDGTVMNTLNAQYIDGQALAQLDPTVPLKVCPPGTTDIRWVDTCTVSTYGSWQCTSSPSSAPACPSGCTSIAHVNEVGSCCSESCGKTGCSCVQTRKRKRRDCDCPAQTVGYGVAP